MARVSTNISLDKDLKKQALLILGKLGMDLSTFVSMSLRQMIRDKAVNFDIDAFKPTKASLEAMAECDDIGKHPKNHKLYTDLDELMKDLDA